MKNKTKKSITNEIELKPDILLKIVNNGIILKKNSDDQEIIQLFEFDDIFNFFHSKEDTKKLIEFLYTLIEYLGLNNSKYSKYAFEIRLVHGYKFECNDFKCEICNEDKED